jgi:hypothetical protein
MVMDTQILWIATAAPAVKLYARSRIPLVTVIIVSDGRGCYLGTIVRSNQKILYSDLHNITISQLPV